MPSILIFSNLLVVLSVAWWSMHRIEARARSDLANALNTVVATSREGLKIWADAVKADAEAYATLPQVLHLLEARPRGEKAPSQSAAPDRSSDLPSPVRRLIAQRGYHDFVVVAPDGTQVAASAAEMVGGRDVFDQAREPITAALNGTTALGLPSWTAIAAQDTCSVMPLLIAAAPVRDERGQVNGAFVLRLEPSREFTRVTQLGRIGESGETYAFDKAGRMVTESRFESQLRSLGLVPRDAGTLGHAELRDPGGDMTKGYRPAQPLAERPLTRMARSALVGESGADVSTYRDYRGVWVVGAWSWIGELGIGLATEMDASEAFETLNRTRLLIAFMLAVTVAAGSGVAVVLARRARVLAKTVAREQAIGRERDEMLAVVSHDLGNPLQSIQLNTEAVLRHLPQSSPFDAVRRRAECILGAIRQMAHLIASLLGAARIMAGSLRIEPRPCSLVELTAKAVELLTPIAAAKQIALSMEHEGPAEVLVDPECMQQVFSNIIGNAIKFTPEQGRIKVRTARIGEKEALVAVSDNGVGIAPEDLPRIFGRYWRSNHPKTGAGLGLHIAKEIVEAHGGRIRAESWLGSGTTICFTLPLV